MGSAPPRTPSRWFARLGVGLALGLGAAAAAGGPPARAALPRRAASAQAGAKTDELARRLAAPDRELRWRAAWELSSDAGEVLLHLGALHALLAEADPELRWVALRALEAGGSQAPAVLPELLVDVQRAASDDDLDVRWAALRALRAFGARDAASMAAWSAARESSDPGLAHLADEALGELEREAASARPTTPEVAPAPEPPPPAALSVLQGALLEASGPEGPAPEAEPERREPEPAAPASGAAADNEEHGGRAAARLALGWTGLAVLGAWCAVQLANGLVWTFRPARAIEFAERAERRLGAFWPRALGLAAWASTPRAVDAWLAARLALARQTLVEEPSLRAQSAHAEPHAQIGDATERVTVELFARIFQGAAPWLAIVGAGGTGKTHLAALIADLALEPSAAARPFAAPVLPLFFEHEQPLRDVASRANWLELFQRRAGDLVDEPVSRSLALALVRTRRLAVIVDGLSEMDAEVRSNVAALQRLWPALPLVVTARPGGVPPGWTGTVLTTERLQGPDLARFLDEVLRQRLGPSALNDADFFRSCAGLVDVADERPVTALVAALFAEAWVARANGAWTLPLPRTVPELFLDHARRALGARGEHDGALWARDLAALARVALGERFSPGPFSRQLAHRTLAGAGRALFTGRSHRALEARIAGLCSAGLLRSADDGETLAFVLDPLAEVFAAVSFAEEAGASSEAWRELGERIRRSSGGAAMLRAAGFCDALAHALRGRERNEPAGPWRAIASELALAPTDAAAGDARTVRRALSDLASPSAAARVGALEALAPWREGAAAYAPEIAERLSDEDPRVRARAADALVRLGATAVPTLTALYDAVPDGERSPARDGACEVLARLGPAAVNAAPGLAARVEEGREARAPLAALRAMGPGASAAVPALARAWRNLAAEQVARRVDILRTLGAIGGDEAVATLVEALEHADERHDALVALAELGPAARPAVPALVACLAEPAGAGRSALVRAAAARALESAGDASERVCAALRRALDDPSEIVRAESASALAELEPVRPGLRLVESEPD